MPLKVRFALVIAVAIVSAVGAQETPAFRGVVHTVSIYATVETKSGRLVPDLTKDDFEVSDNGKRQILTVFKHDVQPATLVIMVDRSGSAVWSNDQIEAMVERLIGNLLPADRARIGGFSGRIDLAPKDFTSDHDELLRALRGQRQDAGFTPLWNAANEALDALATEKGRRALIILSDSKDTPDPAAAPTSPTAAKATLASVTARAQAQDIAVYAIGMAGRVRAPSPTQGPAHGPALFDLQGRSGRGRQGGRGGTPTGPATPIPGLLATPDPGLKKLTADSGGDYFELNPIESVVTTCEQIVDAIHHPYVLAFAAARVDGAMHVLSVAVRRGDLLTRARKAYMANESLEPAVPANSPRQAARGR